MYWPWPIHYIVALNNSLQHIKCMFLFVCLTSKSTGYGSCRTVVTYGPDLKAARIMCLTQGHT